MIYRIDQIKLKLNESLDLIPKKIASKVGIEKVEKYSIVKESIDARDKSNILRVYSVDFECDKRLKLNLAPDMTYHQVKANPSWENRPRPVVVGFGPAGMFAALILAQAGVKPIVLERGADVDTRMEKVSKFWETGKLDVNSNVQFGEGGAGTFSDGKLTTGIKDVRIRKVLEEFVNHGAEKEILYEAKPHIGTDVLRFVVKGLREEIRALGGDVIFNARVDEIVSENDKLTGLGYVDLETGKTNKIKTDTAIFAIGHSARDTFRYLNSIGIEMAQKPFSIGVRIEHPQDMIDIAQYGKPARELGLPVATYKINHRCENGRGVYTFCMCPGGHVIVASSEEGMVVTNGMSYHKRNSGTANSALLVDVRTEDFGSDDVLAGVEFQEKYERLAYKNGGSNYKPPKCTWGELKSDRAPLVSGSLPEFAVSAMKEAMPHLGHKIKGFDSDDAIVTATETRSSSPVRFARDENYEGSIKGFYPIGEGAGYAGGIMSAAVDGIKAAEKVLY